MSRANIDQATLIEFDLTTRETMVKASFFSKWMKRLKPAKDSNQNMAGQPDDDDVIRFIVAHQTRILSRQAWEQFHARFHAQFPTLNSEKIFSLILIAEQNGAIPPANGAARAVLGPGKFHSHLSIDRDFINSYAHFDLLIY